MTAIWSWFDTPLGIAMVKAFYLPYALPVYAVVIWGLVRRSLSHKELALLGCTVLLWVLEVIQLAYSGLSLLGNNPMGLPRYLGVFSPFFWVILAVAIVRALQVHNVMVKWSLRTLMLAAVVWLAISQCEQLWSFYRKGARRDTEIASGKAAQVIKRDYAGPARQERAVYCRGEYFTTRRPVVFGNYAAAAWMVRGQSGGALQTGCPYRDDYRLIRVEPNSDHNETLDAREYDYVVSFKTGFAWDDGTPIVWRLFRRKSTPHCITGSQEERFSVDDGPDI